MRDMVKNFLEVLDLTPGHMGGLHMSITDEIYYNTVLYNIGDSVLNPDGPRSILTPIATLTKLLNLLPKPEFSNRKQG